MNPLPISMDRALRALSKERTLAAIFGHLAEHCATAFRGTEAKGPTKLLRGTDGSTGRANVDDVLAVEEVLRRAANAARAQCDALLRATVVVTGAEEPGSTDADGDVGTSVIDRAALDTKRKTRPEGS